MLLTNFLPSLKVDDYCNNITEELNKIYEEAEKDDEEEIEISKENEENENEEKDLKLDVNRRRLNMKDKKITKYKIISIEKNKQNFNRILNNNESNENTELIKEIEYIDSSEYKNYSDINLREFSSNGEKNDASTTINQYKEGLAGDEEQKLKNSSKIIHTTIKIDDNLGIIKYINMNSSIQLNDNSN